MKIKVSVPATSANVGSGFDALGLAVTLYNTVTFEESDKLDISAADGTRIPRNESNSGIPLGQGSVRQGGQEDPAPENRADQPHPHGPGPGFFLGLHHRGPAGREPDAGRCAQHPGAADAGHGH